MLLSIKDRTTGKYYDGAAFAQATQAPLLTATVAGTNWHYALDQSKLTSPHLYEVEVHAIDNVGNVETPTQVRFSYGTDVGAPSTTLSLTAATHAALSNVGAGTHALLRHGARRRRLQDPRRRDRRRAASTR